MSEVELTAFELDGILVISCDQIDHSISLIEYPEPPPPFPFLPSSPLLSPSLYSHPLPSHLLCSPPLLTSRPRAHARVTAAQEGRWGVEGEWGAGRKLMASHSAGHNYRLQNHLQRRINNTKSRFLKRLAVIFNFLVDFKKER